MTTTVAQLLASSSSSNNSKTGNARKRRDTTTTARGARPQHQQQSARPRRPPQSTQSPSKWRSLLMLALLMAQLQELLRSGSAGSGAGLALALAVPAATAATAAAATAVAPPAPAPLIDSAAKLAAERQTRRTRRMQKRHESISFQMSFQRELRNTVPDWSNSCGGKWIGPDRWPRPVTVPRRQSCLHHKQRLRTLRNNTRRELVQLRDDNALRHLEHSVKAQDTGVVQAIDISKHKTWSLHNSQYDFLPRVNVSKQLSLQHAHHDLQFYVAAFSYLRHAQLHWDLENLQKQSVLSAELLRLRNSARLMLCNFEEAFNSSRLYAPNHKTHKTLRTVKRVPMEKKLMKLKTPLVELHRQAVLAADGQRAEKPRQPDSLDLRFVKYQYIQYLRHLTKLLAKQSKRDCKATKENKRNKQTNRHQPASGLST
ncbi:uncharacterized protein LOC6583978 [Drosophila mojavensis]|nr:uncharacterized protein LOC6583978 [Drosophila mojavensis]